MVWFQFYQYVFIGTHKDWRKEERLGKQRKEKPKAEKQRKRERAAIFCLSGPPPPPRAHNVGTKPEIPGWETAGAQPHGAAGGNSQVPQPPSPPVSIPTAALPRPATYFWSIPAGRAPAGRAGQRPRPRAWWQRPLARSALTSTQPCQPPNQAATRLEPTARPPPPNPAPSHRLRRSALSSAGLRHRVEEGTPPRGGGRDRQGRSRRDPWGARLAQVTRTRGGQRGAGRGLGRVLDRASRS